MFDPLNACGMVMISREHDSGSVLSGSCFMFRSNQIVLTAAHCVPENLADVKLVFPRLGVERQVKDIRRNPSADIALLVCDGGDARSNGNPTIAFWDSVPPDRLGEDSIAYGFPALGPDVTPRLFKPYFQRFFDYTNPAGQTYAAGELSLPAPGGLSGSPLFHPERSQMVFALVTANLETYAVTDSIDEVDDNGKVLRVESRKIVSFGLSLMLQGVDEWLNAQSDVWPAYSKWVSS